MVRHLGLRERVLDRLLQLFENGHACCLELLTSHFRLIGSKFGTISQIEWLDLHEGTLFKRELLFAPVARVADLLLSFQVIIKVQTALGLESVEDDFNELLIKVAAAQHHVSRS